MINMEFLLKHGRQLAAIPYYPTDVDAREAILRQLAKMVGSATMNGATPEMRIAWLIEAAVTAMRGWTGVPDLRGIYCTRWKPADGIEADCILPGYSANDCEARAIAENTVYKRQLAGGSAPRQLEAGTTEEPGLTAKEEVFGKACEVARAQQSIQPTHRERLAVMRFEAELAGEYDKADRLAAELQRTATRSPAERRALADTEKEIAAAAARPTLTAEVKAARLAELEAALASRAKPANQAQGATT